MSVILSNGQHATFKREFNAKTLQAYEKNLDLPTDQIDDVIEINIEDTKPHPCGK